MTYAIYKFRVPYPEDIPRFVAYERALEAPLHDVQDFGCAALSRYIPLSVPGNAIGTLN